MAKRERYPGSVECPECGQAGRVEVSEFENLVYSGGVRDIRIERVLSGRFLYELGKLTCECRADISHIAKQ